jgi:plastocyanin
MRIDRESRTARATVIACAIGLLGAVGLVAGATTSAAVADGVSHHWTVLAGSQSADGSISGARFLPGEIWIDQGDTVTWAANSVEPHTVTFFPSNGTPAGPFNPGDPTQVTRMGSGAVDGTYQNSGVLTTVPIGQDFGPFPPFVTPHQDYTLSFPGTGDFDYYCLVHGVMMKGTVHVAPAGTAYPFTQARYNAQAAAQARAIRLDGNRLRAHALGEASRHRVMVGADDGNAMVMRFLRHSVTVHVGDTVLFDNSMGMGPHTVTFGEEPVGAGLESYLPAASYGGGDLSSFLPPGLTFAVTFTHAGTYHYICALHDVQGMVGRVIVRP